MKAVDGALSSSCCLKKNPTILEFKEEVEKKNEKEEDGDKKRTYLAGETDVCCIYNVF